MPRGKYDRKESRITRLEQNLTQANDKAKVLKDELEKKDIELRATKKLAEVASRLPPSSDILPTEKFTVLRDNLRTLSESRQVLVNSDSVSTEVLAMLDSEITSHLRLLGALRQDSFRGMEQGDSKPAQTPVPLPATVPSFFQPPAFRSIKTAG